MTGLSLVSNFLKVTKKDWILSAAPKRADFADFRRSSAKIVNIFHQSYNAKTDRLSILFLMICEGWVFKCPKAPILPIFGGRVQKNCEYFSSKCQCKNWTANLPLCNDMWNLVAVLPVWLWCLISQKWQKGLDFASGAHKPKLPLKPKIKMVSGPI